MNKYYTISFLPKAANYIYPFESEGDRFNKLDCESNKCGFIILENVEREEFLIYKDLNLLTLFKFLSLIIVSILYLFLKIKDKYFKSSMVAVVSDLCFRGKSQVWLHINNAKSLVLWGTLTSEKNINKVANAKGVRYLSKLCGIIFKLFL